MFICTELYIYMFSLYVVDNVDIYCKRMRIEAQVHAFPKNLDSCASSPFYRICSFDWKKEKCIVVKLIQLHFFFQVSEVELLEVLSQDPFLLLHERYGSEMFIFLNKYNFT